MKTVFNYIIGLLFVLMISQSLFSQQNKLNTDSLFKQAQTLFKNGDNNQAEKICLDLLESNPNNIDVHLLLANGYMWNKKFKEAKPHIDYVLSKDEKNYEALTANLNWYFWSTDYAGCIAQCDKALKFYPDDVNFKLRKAACLAQLNKPDDALTLVNEVLVKDPTNAEALKLKESLYYLTLKNRIAVGYVYDHYQSNVIPATHLAYLEYARKLNFGTLIGRVNYANRFKKNGIQGEADAYITLDKNSYGYLNAGLSNDSIFPHYRFGAEYYRSLPAKFEASLGVRDLKFYPTNIFIYTGSVGKYVGKWWFSGRAYVTPKNSTVSTSALLYARRYQTKYDYLGIRLNYGVLPDLNADLLNNANSFYMKSLGARLEYSKLFAKQWLIEAALGYENQEWLTKRYRDVLTIDLKLSYSF